MACIPYIIHQTGPDVLEDWTKSYIASLKHWHPHWQYMWWSDNDLHTLIQSDYSWLLPVYLKCSNIQRSDIGRYCILHRHGGMYVDTDMFFLAAVDPVIARAPCGLWLAHSPRALPTDKDLLSNYMLASPPNDPFWLKVLHEASFRLQHESRPWWALNTSLLVPYTTGRNVISKFAFQEGSVLSTVNVFKEPEILNLFCSHTSVPSGCIGVHNGGTSREFKSQMWSGLNGIAKIECELRKVFGVVPNKFQAPICLITTVICSVALVIGLVTLMICRIVASLKKKPLAH